MKNSETFTLDRTGNALVLTRRLSASPQRLFEAWTKPEQISRWWDPSGRELAQCEIELCEGGILRLVNAGGEAHPFEGRFRAINPPRGFTFDAMGATGSVRFVPEGEQTQMTVEIQCASPEHLEQFVRMGIGDGTSRSLDNLVRYLGAEQ